MNDRKDRKTNDESPDDRSLKSLHRALFDCPDDNDWEATRSLAQPSFLKQIDSCGGAHSTPARYFFSRVREQAATPGWSETLRETSDRPTSAPASRLIESGNSSFFR